MYNSVMFDDVHVTGIYCTVTTVCVQLGRSQTSRGLRLRTWRTLHLVLVCLSDIVYQLANWLIVNKYTEPGNLSAVLSAYSTAAAVACG